MGGGSRNSAPPHPSEDSERSVLPPVATLPPEQSAGPAPGPASPEAASPGAAALAALRAHLDAGGTELSHAPFAHTPLSRAQAEEAGALLWRAHSARLRQQLQAEFEVGALELDGMCMPIWWATFGSAPFGERRAVISMHGGGGCPPAVNDSQWENQKHLYELDEGVYVVPRAPTNNWNLWHEPHIDKLFDRLIQGLVVILGAHPDKIYLTGYSAGGDGCYQLAARMADRFAAAGAMAGHPNDTRKESLRNLPFALHCGAHDHAYNRAGVAREWSTELRELQAADPGRSDGAAYLHDVVLHDTGHWMCGGERLGLAWMLTHTRVTRPRRVVWVQSPVTHARSYWLACDAPRAGGEVVAELRGQTVQIEAAVGAESLEVRLDDAMLDLDAEVTVTGVGGQQMFRGVCPRTIGVLARTLAERGDPQMMFAACVPLRLPSDIPTVRRLESGGRKRSSWKMERVLLFLAVSLPIALGFTLISKRMKL